MIPTVQVTVMSQKEAIFLITAESGMKTLSMAGMTVQRKTRPTIHKVFF